MDTGPQSDRQIKYGWCRDPVKDSSWFCQMVRNAKPNEDIHRYRVFDIAIVDFGLVVVGVVLLVWFFGWNFWKTLLVALLIGIIVHRMFDVRTTVDKLLFP